MAQSRKTVNVVPTKQEAPDSSSSAQNKLTRLQLFLTGSLSAFLTVSVFCTPEGAIREGDYLPIALLFFFLAISSSLLVLRFTSFLSKGNPVTKDTCSDNDFLTNASKVVPLVADGALFLFLVLCTISCLKVVVFHTGDVRLALNGYWTFITPILTYFLFRSLRPFISARVVLTLCLALCACGVAECAFSVYSYAVVNPRIRVAYQADPDKLLAENGMTFAKDSRERLLFEKRLLESVEPTGTYGLTNTLAGTIAPLLLLAIVSFPWLRVWSRDQRRTILSKKLTIIRLLLGGGAILLAFYTLLTTKSRSACLALGGGTTLWFVLWLFCQIRSGGKAAKRGGAFVLIAFILVGVMGIIAFLTGAIDREIFTEAGKSLGYRLDYWRATSRMIADSPWLGIGPGEFQSLYARYILPTASEFIADPHNFAFEICALFGVPALLSFATFIGATFVCAFQASKRQHSFSSKEQQESSGESKAFLTAAFAGIALGLIGVFFCSFFLSAPVDLNFYGIAFVAVGIFVFLIWGLNVGANATSTLAIVCAIVTSLINLCAAGGVGYAPISTTLLILAAVVVNRSSNDDATISKISVNRRVRRTATICLFVSVATGAVFYYSSYSPRMNAFLFELRYATSPDLCTAELLKDGAVKQIDPASSVVVSRYYYATGLAYFQSPNEENQKRWQAAREKLKNVSPNSSPIRERGGEFDQLQFERNKERSEYLDSAIELFRESVELSPNDVERKERLFKALKEAGRNAEAQYVARQALEFDKLTPHEDRKLSDESRQEMVDFVNWLE